MTHYYQPSGKFSPSSFFFFIIACLTAAPLLGLIYAYAIWYIPFIYINFFIAAGFGILTGVALNYLVIRLGKVRNRKLALLFGLLGGMFALYCHWAIWLDLVLNAGESYGNERLGVTVSNISIVQAFSLILDPSAVMKLIALVNEHGTWGIRGATVSGIFLSVIWVIEAVIVLGGPVILTYLEAKKPFSETTQAWTKEKSLPALEYIEDPGAFKSELERGEVTSLISLKKAESVENKHSLLTLYYSDASEYYLSVNNKMPEVDNKGKVTFKSDEFIEYLSLDADTGEMLMKIAEAQLTSVAS